MLWKCCKNIVDVAHFLNKKKFLPKISATTIFFFFLPFLATWLPQFIFSLSSIPYNFGNLIATIGKSFGHSHWALHGPSLGSGMNFGNIIIEIYFFSLLITSLNFLLSYFFLQFQQRCCWNSVSLLILLNHFEQYL